MLADCRHAREAVCTTAGAAPDQVGFDLVFALMRRQQVETAMLSTPFGEQRVARLTRGFLYSGCRLVCRPGEHFVPDSPRCKPAMQKADFRPALGTQPVIHRQRTDASPALARPLIGQNRKCETIGASGNCDGEKRAGLEAGERGEGGRKLRRAKGRRPRSSGQQPSFFFSSLARSLIALPGFGKS